MQNVMREREDNTVENYSSERNNDSSVRVSDRSEANSDSQDTEIFENSSSEDGDISEADSFVLGDGDEELVLGGFDADQDTERAVLTNSFLLAARHSNPEFCGMSRQARVDPDTEAKLVAFFAAVSSASNPHALTQLTSTVSSALEDAADALKHMDTDDPEQNGLVITPGLVTSSKSCSGASHSSSCGNSASSCESNSSSRSGSTPEDCERTIVEACHDGDIMAVRRMLDDGGNVNETTEDGESLLSLACASGYYDLALILLNAGANVDDRNENGHTPLMEASSGGHVDVAKLLIKRGADVNAFSSEFKESALTLASYKGHVEVVKLLLNKGADYEHKTDEMHTALMEASMDGHVDVARILIEAGAQINMPVESFESPLTLASCGGHKELVQLLLDKRANYQEVNDEGYTPLMEASREGHVDVVQILLDHGVDGNATTDETQETALTLASCGGFTDVVQLLLRRGCDSNLGSSTPIMEAAQEGHVETVEVLLKAGADPLRKAESSGETALMYACENGHLSVIKALLSVKTEFEVHDKTGKTALMQAIRFGHYNVVEILLSAGCDPNNGSPDNSCTPLSIAIENGRAKIVRLLILKGADPKHRLKDNTSMVLEAAKHGHTDIVKILIQFSTYAPENPFMVIDSQVSDAAEPYESSGLTADQLVENLSEQSQVEGSHIMVNRQREQCNSARKTIHKKTNATQCTSRPIKPLDFMSDHLIDQLALPDGDERGMPENMPHLFEQDFECNLYKDEDGHSHPIPIDEFEHHINAYMKSCPKNPVSSNAALSSSFGYPPTSFPCPQNPSDWSIFPASLSRIGEITAKLNEQKIFSDCEMPAISGDTTGSVTAPIVSFSGSHPPAQVPVQERRKLVPSKKQLEKKALHQNKIKQQVVNQLKMGGGETPRQQYDDSPPVSSALSYFVGQDGLFPPGKLFPPEVTESRSKEDLKMINCDSLPEEGCNCAMRYELLKLKNPTVQDINNFFDNMPPLDTSIHLPNCHNETNLPFPAPDHLQYHYGDGNDFSPAQSVGELDRPRITAISQTNQQTFAKSALRQAPVGAVSSKSTVQPTHKYSRSEALVKKSKKSAPSLSLNAPLADPCLKVDAIIPPDQCDPMPARNDLCKVPEIAPNDDAPVAHTVPGGSDNVVQSVCNLDINAASDPNQDSPLNLAAQGGYEEMVSILLQFGADPDHADKKGHTPLVLAAQAGHLNVCKILLRYGSNIEAYPDKSKDTPLCAAAAGGRLDLAELFLQRGANKEHRNVNDYTPLSLAASAGHVSMCVLLLDMGAEINSRTGSKLGISPLMLAAMNGHTQVVKVLLEKGSDINAQIETNKNTALTLACFRGRDQVVKLLLEKKALIEHRAKTGLTPLMEAASGGFVEVGRILLEKGADVNAAPVPSSKDTALTIAADKGHLKFVQLLIENGALVEVKNKKGNSPLWLAANGGFIEVVNLLLTHHANIDSTDNRGVSCLVAAFRRGHVRLVKSMLRFVSQFPSDTELERYMNSVTDLKLLESVKTCAHAIRVSKEKHSVEANKAATDLLLQVEAEKRLEESRKAIARKNRERKKTNKKDNSKKINEKREPVKLKKSEQSKKVKVKQKEAKAESPSDRVAEEKDGDSGIDSNSQTSASSEVKPVTNEVCLKNKKRKRKKDSAPKEEKSNSIITVEEPPPPERHLKSSNNPSSENKKFDSIPESLGFSQDLTHLVNRPRQFPSRSRINTLDTFGEVVETLPVNATKSLISHKKIRKTVDDWQEVSRKSKKIIVPGNAISRVIGRGGCNINKIREISGAHIEVEKQGKSQGDRQITIKGSAEATRQAQDLINSLVEDPDKELLSVTKASKITKSKAYSDSPKARITVPVAIKSTVSSWTGVPSPQKTNKIPPLMQKSPPTRSRSEKFDQSFASKLVEPKSSRPTSNINSLDDIELENSPPTEDRLQSQEYSIFNNPLSQVTQDVASKEPKSFARAASGGLQRPKTPLGHQASPKARFEPPLEPIATKAPGYRATTTLTPANIVKSSTNLSINPIASPSEVQQLSCEDIGDAPSRASPIATIVTCSARSAPGTPIASPSARSVVSNQLRQTVTPPPMLNRNYDMYTVTSKTSPIPSLLGISTSPPQQVVTTMSSSYTSYVNSSSPTTLTNLAPGGPVSTQNKSVVSQFYSKPRPIAQQPIDLQLAQQIQGHMQQQHVSVSHHPPPPPPPPPPSAAGQYQQQLLQPAQLLQSPQNYTQSITSISQLINNMHLGQQNTPVYTAGVAPISHLQSSLNPNAPHFSSRADTYVSQQYRAPVAQFQNGFNQSIYAGAVGQFPTMNAVEPSKMEFNMYQRSATMPIGFRPAVVNQDNINQLHVDSNSVNVAMVTSYMNIDDKSTRLQPIGTERAQKMSEKTVRSMGSAEFLGSFLPRDTPDSSTPANLYYSPNEMESPYNNPQQWNWGSETNP